METSEARPYVHRAPQTIKSLPKFDFYIYRGKKYKFGSKEVSIPTPEEMYMWNLIHDAIDKEFDSLTV